MSHGPVGGANSVSPAVVPIVGGMTGSMRVVATEEYSSLKFWIMGTSLLCAAKVKKS